MGVSSHAITLDKAYWQNTSIKILIHTRILNSFIQYSLKHAVFEFQNIKPHQSLEFRTFAKLHEVAQFFSTELVKWQDTQMH